MHKCPPKRNDGGNMTYRTKMCHRVLILIIEGVGTGVGPLTRSQSYMGLQDIIARKEPNPPFFIQGLMAENVSNPLYSYYKGDPTLVVHGRFPKDFPLSHISMAFATVTFPTIILFGRTPSCVVANVLSIPPKESMEYDINLSHNIDFMYWVRDVEKEELVQESIHHIYAPNNIITIEVEQGPKGSIKWNRSILPY
eukprot:Gb_34141 [translate_table: standard]